VVKRALFFGIAMGVYAIVSVYVIVSLLPGWFGMLIPILGLVLAIAFFWPAWFDRDGPAGAGRRLMRRLGTLACAIPAAALASFLVVWLWPGFIDWSDQQHRDALGRQGKAPADIEQQVALHHRRGPHFLVDGALMTALPGGVAALVTTAAGAILLRRR
jgi:hypothetical protein